MKTDACSMTAPTKKISQDIGKLLFYGYGHEIYAELSTSADECLTHINQAEKNQEVNRQKSRDYRSTVDEEITEANYLRFALTTVDNKIKKFRREHLALRRFLEEQLNGGQKELYEVLYDSLEPQDTQLPVGVRQELDLLEDDVVSSLRLRLQLSWAWDAVLGACRELNVQRVIHYGHLITEMAMQLEDEDVISRVKSILTVLEIKFNEDDHLFALPAATPKLRAKMYQQVETLEGIQEHIARLDKQRSKLLTVKDRLAKRLEQCQSTTSPLLEAEPPAEEKELRKSHRMIFPQMNEDM